MPILKSFKFTPAPDLRQSPEQHRRDKLVEKLREQKSLLADSAYTRTAHRWVERDGNRVREAHQIRVKPWWAQTQDGRVVLLPKFGLKLIEFEKGKPGILLEKESQLADTLEALITATNAGELDLLLARSKPKASKA